MVGQRPQGLKLDTAGYGFIKRKSISLKRHGYTDCAFHEDRYNSAYISRFSVLLTRARFS
ncbi:hypothetical protein QFZ34_003776 [Phyllobacterium ifriqiyense]|uniref:Uncharacterized protein n=1 Tax=Phyllobacterium ifriqiyense TaxID=314238 RepID=A0ABU0SCW0_9HYPH|nr:hypothetical protein [Phyllobacterium ifriqiyense]